MKKFTFPLDRVLDWRRTQAQLEETKLERLHAERRALETSLAEVRRANEEAGRALIAAGSATGAELAALDSFRKASAQECQRLAAAAAQSRQAIAAQMQAVIRKRRDVKLLEHLRDKRLAEWKRQCDAELDREASELHLFKTHTSIK